MKDSRTASKCGGLAAQVAHWGFWLAAWTCLLAGEPRQAVGQESVAFWRHDFKSALAEAEEKRVPLIVHFYADWCLPCQRMEREVLSSTNLKESLTGKCIAVKINSDHHQDLVHRYGVETLPSDVIIDSLTGKVISLRSEFLDKTRYVQMVTQAGDRFSKVHAADRKTVVTSSGIDNGETPVTASGNSDTINKGEPQLVVGLEGFSPVALSKHRKWNKGLPQFAWDYKDVTYYMTTREELVEFRSNPEQFAPKLLGCDPVILWQTDRAVAGSIEYGAFFDDELYLFSSEERRKQFKENPEKFMRLQHALKADKIERVASR